jgi:hypothetical protein
MREMAVGAVAVASSPRRRASRGRSHAGRLVGPKDENRFCIRRSGRVNEYEATSTTHTTTRPTRRVHPVVDVAAHRGAQALKALHFLFCRNRRGNWPAIALDSPPRYIQHRNRHPKTQESQKPFVPLQVRSLRSLCISARNAPPQTLEPRHPFPPVAFGRGGCDRRWVASVLRADHNPSTGERRLPSGMLQTAPGDCHTTIAAPIWVGQSVLASPWRRVCPS